MSSKRESFSKVTELPVEESADALDVLMPQDRVFSGMFGNGWVVELLRTPAGHAFGQRIQFENGTEAELLIVGVTTRH